MIRTETTRKIIPLQKSTDFDVFEAERDTLTKTEIFIASRPQTCCKIDSFLVFTKGTQRHESEFVTKFVGI